MTLSSRFAALGAGVAAACALLSSPVAHAAFPEHPLTLIVPFPAGGGVDTVGRLLAQSITAKTGATVVVENRGGAGGTIGVAGAARAKPDGYVVTLGSPGNISIAPTAYRGLSYDPRKDLTPIAMAVQMPLLLVGRPDAPYSSVAELVAYGKAHPDKLSYASGGTGTSQHLAGGMLNQLAGIQAVHVPYKGSAPALTDVMGGRVDYVFVDTSAMGTVKSGRAKLLAVTNAKRSALLPDTPTIAESGVPGYEALNWYGVFGPGGMDEQARQWWSAQIAAAVADPAFVQKLNAQMLEAPPAMDSAAFTAFIEQDIDKWAGLIRAMDLRLD